MEDLHARSRPVRARGVCATVRNSFKSDIDLMKLPRWLVILMLSSSVLAVLAAAGWWWVTWPERTAREVFLALCDGRVNGVFEIVGEDPTRMSQADTDLVRSFCPPQPLESLGSRTLLDFALARQMFAIYRKDGNVVLALRIERGRIFAMAW